MTATTYKVRSSHPEDDAQGRVFAPGELVPDLDVDDEYNQEKIEAGVFFLVGDDGDEPPSTEGSEEPDATDAAVRLAKEHDIDLSELKGSGKDDRIIDEDVQTAIEAKEKADADKGGS